MTKDLQLFRSCFSPLPAEIRQAILSEMPDVPTLHSAIDVDDSLRSVFWNNESTILKNVLQKTIHPRLIPEVLAVLDSTRFHFGKVKLRVADDPWTRDGVSRLLGHYFQRQPVFIKWKLEDALTISKIYEHVHFFVNDFASSALSNLLVNDGKSLSPSPLSSNERCRIEGAFLRFELFCNLFRERADKQECFESDELSGIFFNKFSPWENEQLACVNDYLSAKILIPFDDVADHDVWWGEERISAHEECSPSAEYYIQGTISKGLGYIHRLVTASTYEERYEMLDIMPSTAFDFLSDGLMEREMDVADQPLSEFDEKKKKAFASKSSLEDPDSGPYNAWYWAHAHDYGEGLFFDSQHQSLRGGGYVMWDDWRLLERNIFSKPFDNEDCPPLPGGPSEERQREVEESWKRRAEIHVRGGRGWWSKDDESKIVWPKDRPPQWSGTVPAWD